MNAIIWLSDKEDANMPIEVNADARKNKPMYEPHVPPESIFPIGLPNL